MLNDQSEVFAVPESLFDEQSSKQFDPFFYYEIIKCSLARLHVVEGMLRAACCEQSLVWDSILDVEARLEFVIKLTEERLSVFDGGRYVGK
ncbi:hypothetical protein [Xylella fastidiosa]|uniref:hypothetical protein n=1 Tax=Xylella fastidiosa TaxID=2371 RepID=UPI001892C191|nr:hypothetical protein [Xylella fastidiosa]QPC02711.1 hypothetical protein IUD19_02745 [Xylella fastidiosa subsp. multiplex]